MKKVLFISNLGKRVGSFSKASIIAAKKNEMKFYYAANWEAATNEQMKEDEKKYGIKLVNVDLDRSPYSLKNLKGYKQLIDFVKSEKIDFIHCNTPVGGVFGRIVGEKCKVKKVIYQVHGFHFYDGAPKKNWLIYYPIEKWLAKKTDAIITINKEDYERAQKFVLRNNGKKYYIPGVGIELSKYKKSESMRFKKRNELKLNNSDYMVISVGELNNNKNNRVIIEALARIKRKNIHYYLCGVGSLENELRELSRDLGVEKQVHFLGYRYDIDELLLAADIFVMPSIREGLSRSLMEAMASGLPCIVSNIRGNVDLVKDNVNGFICSEIDEYAFAIQTLIQSQCYLEKFGLMSLELIKNFSFENVVDLLTNVYREEFKI